MFGDFNDQTILDSMSVLHKVPVFLDDNPEMQVGVMLINPGYIMDFDACPPMRTHKKSCPVHKQHVDHYSIPSLDKKPAFKIEVKVTPQ